MCQLFVIPLMATDTRALLESGADNLFFTLYTWGLGTHGHQKDMSICSLQNVRVEKNIRGENLVRKTDSLES